MKKIEIYDYKGLRLNNIVSPKYRHLFLLLFWMVHGILFAWIETSYPVDHYVPMYAPLDDIIPFNEWFLIPYVFWFLFIILMNVYLLLFDVPTFKKMTLFFIITYGVTLVIYLIYPTCQELRPESFARNNMLTRFMQAYYDYDTNTNVCPSLHVIGSLAVSVASWHAKGMEKPWIKIAMTAMGVLISISTVFVKQHSVLDIYWAIPLCVLGYLIAFHPIKFKKK